MSSQYLEQWKQALEPQEYEIEPRGPVFLMRRAGVMDLIEQGQIPDTLSGEAIKLASSGAIGRKWTMDELRDYVGIVNVVVKASVVAPRITDEGGEDSLAVGDIPFVWRVKIFNWAGESVGPLRRFRPQQNGSAQAVELIKKLQQAAQPDSGDRG